jgi:hypothetical protein
MIPWECAATAPVTPVPVDGRVVVIATANTENTEMIPWECAAGAPGAPVPVDCWFDNKLVSIVDFLRQSAVKCGRGGGGDHHAGKAFPAAGGAADAQNPTAGGAADAQNPAAGGAADAQKRVPITPGLYLRECSGGGAAETTAPEKHCPQREGRRTRRSASLPQNVYT